jgi:hypothetical protein
MKMLLRQKITHNCPPWEGRLWLRKALIWGGWDKYDRCYQCANIEYIIKYILLNR